MSDRMQLNDDQLEDVVGGELTFTWFGGQGECGINGQHKFKFENKSLFTSTMNDCMKNKGMSDIDTLKYLYKQGIIHT